MRNITAASEVKDLGISKARCASSKILPLDPLCRVLALLESKEHFEAGRNRVQPAS